MTDGLSQNILNVCDSLNKNNVQYLLVGGAAVAFHGYYRITTVDDMPAEKEDVDFWLNPNYTNYYNLLNALKNLGQDVTDFMSEKTPTPLKSFYKCTFDNFTLDFLPKIPGHSKFNNCYNSRQSSIINNIEIFIISYDDLVITKLVTARKKDIEDIKNLEANRKK